MSKTGVKGTILVQAHPSKEEADWLISIAEDNPFVLGVVAWLNLASKNFEKEVQKTTDSNIEKIDKILAEKEKEILNQ